MEPLKFPEANETMGKAQPQYRALPVFISALLPGTPQEHNQYTCKYELSDFELAIINKTKSFYFSQFGQCFHPILPQVESPFIAYRIKYKKHDDGTYLLHVTEEGDKIVDYWVSDAEQAVKFLVDKYPNVQPESLIFEEVLTTGIDENGNIIDL